MDNVCKNANIWFILANNFVYSLIINKKRKGKLSIKNKKLIAIEVMANFRSLLICLVDDNDDDETFVDWLIFLRELNKFFKVNKVKKIIKKNGIKLSWNSSNVSSHKPGDEHLRIIFVVWLNIIIVEFVSFK